MEPYFEIYESTKPTGALGGLVGMSMRSTEWRWRLRAGNHKIIADSGESYQKQDDCLHGIVLVMGTSTDTPIKTVK